MAENENKTNQVQLGDKVVGQIELPTIDVSKYIGKDVPIEEITEHEGDFKDDKGRPSYYIKVSTAPVDSILRGEDLKDIRASKIFGLHYDAEGKLGWGENTKLGVYLKKMQVAHYNELKGKVVKVQTQTSKKGKDFLTFN